MPVGTKVELEGLRITVTGLTADGRVERARFAFAAPLEDARYDFASGTAQLRAVRPARPRAIDGAPPGSGTLRPLGSARRVRRAAATFTPTTVALAAATLIRAGESVYLLV